MFDVATLRSGRSRACYPSGTKLNYHPTSIAALLILLVSVAMANAQDSDGDTANIRRDIDQLRSQVRELESENQQLEQIHRKLVDESDEIGIVLILFGTVCALWAQNTGRNPWLWFFLGLFFSVITVPFLLSKNASDLGKKRRFKPSFDDSGK